MKINQNALILDSKAMSPNRENVSIFENYPQLNVEGTHSSRFSAISRTEERTEETSTVNVAFAAIVMKIGLTGV